MRCPYCWHTASTVTLRARGTKATIKADLIRLWTFSYIALSFPFLPCLVAGDAHPIALYALCIRLIENSAERQNEALRTQSLCRGVLSKNDVYKCLTRDMSIFFLVSYTLYRYEEIIVGKISLIFSTIVNMCSSIPFAQYWFLVAQVMTQKIAVAFTWRKYLW